MFVAFEPQTTNRRRPLRGNEPFQTGTEMLDRVVAASRMIWRRKCNAIIRSRILRHQRQIQSADPHGSATNCMPCTFTNPCDEGRCATWRRLCSRPEDP